MPKVGHKRPLLHLGKEPLHPWGVAVPIPIELCQVLQVPCRCCMSCPFTIPICCKNLHSELSSSAFWLWSLAVLASAGGKYKINKASCCMPTCVLSAVHMHCTECGLHFQVAMDLSDCFLQMLLLLMSPCLQGLKGCDLCLKVSQFPVWSENDFDATKSEFAGGSTTGRMVP